MFRLQRHTCKRTKAFRETIAFIDRTCDGQPINMEVANFLVYCWDQNYGGSEKCLQELISEKLLILLRDRPCLE